MHRALPLLLILLVAAPAWGEDEPQGAWVVVVDLQTEAALAQALPVAEALERQGTSWHLLFVGENAEGRLRTQRVAPSEVDDTADRIRAFRTRLHDRPAQVHAILGAVAKDADADRPCTVLLVGGFRAPEAPAEPPTAESAEDEEEGVAPDEDEDPDKDEDPESESEGDENEDDASPPETGWEAWQARTSKGDRVLTVGAADETLRALNGARGWVSQGVLVLGVGTPEIQTLSWRPMDPAAPSSDATLPLRARLPLKTTAIGQAPPSTTLHARPSLASRGLDGTWEGDVYRVPFRPSCRARFVWQWPQAPDFQVLALVELPEAFHVTWSDPEPVWALTGPGQATDVLATGPGGIPPTPLIMSDAGTHTWTLMASTTLDARGWQPRALVDEASDPRLRVQVGPPEDSGSPAWVRRTITVTWTPAPSLADQQVRARLHLAEGRIPLPMTLKAPAGVVRLAWKGPPPHVRLPQGEAAQGGVLRVDRVSGRVPARVPLALSWRLPGTTLPGLIVRSEGEAERRVPADTPFDVPVDADIHVAPFLADAAAWQGLRAGTGSLRIDGAPDVEALTLDVEPRRPVLRLEPDEIRVHVERGQVRADPHPRLVLDVDGATDAWATHLMATAPTVTDVDADAPFAWEVQAASPGIWHVRPIATAALPEDDAFENQQMERRLRVAWPHGGVPRDVRAQVVVPARWGQRGWVFVGLAVLALALAAFTFWKLRAPALRGTLLYTVEGLKATVGRLDLSTAGRGATALRADTRGKLHLGGDGTVVALLRTTRVGGMLEAEDEDGDVVRHLLVDGMTVQAGAHVLRYLSGMPSAEDLSTPLVVPDLLGPEFDLDTGAIDALDGPADT